MFQILIHFTDNLYTFRKWLLVYDISFKKVSAIHIKYCFHKLKKCVCHISFSWHTISMTFSVPNYEIFYWPTSYFRKTFIGVWHMCSKSFSHLLKILLLKNREMFILMSFRWQIKSINSNVSNSHTFYWQALYIQTMIVGLWHIF